MQSSMVVAGMGALSDPAKTFDTSGKSAARFHHRAICKTPMALPKNGRFGAIAVKNPYPQLKFHRLATEPLGRNSLTGPRKARPDGLNRPFQANHRTIIVVRRTHRSRRHRRPNRPETIP